MKFKSLLIICLLSVSILQAQNEETKMDSLSYAVGIWLGNVVKQQGFGEVDATTISKAMNDVLQGNPTSMNAQSAGLFLKEHMEAKKAKQQSANLEEGKTFLEENAKREGVTVLESGLQYEVMTQGEGPVPQATDKVSVHYHGTLINGTVFDSSVERGSPAEFPVTGVIKGWVEALQLMNVGSKWKLFIPSELAYGERGAGGDIGPNTTLIFEVELLGIQ